ncbi:PREDICTED: uncharacterized protein LOC105454464 [Wasmannia auropunctata]|uniref:uncharacterized protein LOC105454464 n=1 Tax=Wasmannia auropunctata TaxID=64793 RepID=UPI0005F049C5|nr:PREDICTED: uncharacterized protein LOC105454464 [Wasmannia auropunctata]
METDRDAFNFTAVLAPALLTFATCLTIFYRLRARWPVKVNCWFCSENTKIWRQHLDWWLCPWCEQYNGFAKNGDYAYDIPEQYATPRVRTRYCRPQAEVGGNGRSHVLRGNLCECCNKRESLKLSELSSFEPKSERLYDAELRAFREHLEARYPLCDSCKSTVRDVLRRQAAWLTRCKMLLFRRRPIKTLVGNAKKWETTFRAISTLLVSTVIYNQNFIWPPIGGLFFHLCACWASSMRNRRFDVPLIPLWLCVISLVFIEDLTLAQNVWLATEEITQYRMIEVCAFITALVSIRSSLCKGTLTGSVAFKKIKLHSRDAVVSPRLAYNSRGRNSSAPSEANDNIKPSVYAADELASAEIKFAFSKSHSAILRQKLSTITNASERGINGYLNSVSPNEYSPPDSCYLNDSLSSLLLSEESSPRGGRFAKATPAIFERRVYSSTSSENLFRRSSSGAYSSKRRCILSPPKLRSVTQTSWVAGGYWQEGMMTTATPPLTLSRSSSQSSGFGSSVGSSNLAPSREPSVHEFDRCSVVSEATRWSCQTTTTPRPGRQVARHDSPRPQSRYSDVAAATGSRERATVPSPVALDDRVREAGGARRPDVEMRNGSVPSAFAGHHATTTTTTTIVASPGWLSALLCGSLILNMIVLCTTLLR